VNTTNDTPLSDVEARLRAEFADRADNATGADRILTALANQPLRLRARHRSPSIGRWATVAAVVALVAAGIPVGLHLAGHSPQLDTATPSTSRGNGYELTYIPGWLPVGFLATARTGSLGGAEQKSQWDGPIGGTVNLSVWHTDTVLGQGELHQIQLATHSTTVNGQHAALSSESEFATVEWQLDQDTVVQVMAGSLPDAVTTAEKVARSVAPADPLNPPAVTAGLSFGSLPSGYQPYSQSAVGHQPRPTRVIEAGDAAPSATVDDLTAQLTPPRGSVPLPGGQHVPVTIRGRSGSYIGGGAPTVGVELADGSWLTVTSGPMAVPGRITPPRLTEDQLVAIADGITIDANADFSWLSP
jgi:hypothetical protein